MNIKDFTDFHFEKMKRPHGSFSKQMLSLLNTEILFAVTLSQCTLEQGTFFIFVKNDQF
jgi:hypothetical protein